MHGGSGQVDHLRGSVDGGREKTNRSGSGAPSTGATRVSSQRSVGRVRAALLLGRILLLLLPPPLLLLDLPLLLLAPLLRRALLLPTQSADPTAARLATLRYLRFGTARRTSSKNGTDIVRVGFT
eukprot:6181342-Pleurochrysis_carterae.AAC.2